MMRETATTLLDTAIGYALRGWRVFPLIGKIPAVAGGAGCLDATCDIDQVRTWWRQYPTANIGIATGPDSGLVVVDLDGPDARAAWLGLTNRLGPIDTATARTGRADGGLHVYLAWPASEHVKSHAQGGWSERTLGCRKMEVIADGRYVVAPGSLHPETGERYAWLDDADVASMPEWLLERLADREPTVAAKPIRPRVESDAGAARKRYVGNLNAAYDRVAGLGRGERNNALVKEAYALGGLIHTGHITDFEIRDALRSACGHWPIGERDVRKDHAAIDRGIEAGKAMPYELPERARSVASAMAEAWHAETDAAIDTRPATSDGYEPFVPFEDGGVLPSFPVHTLSPWMREYAEAVALSTRFSVDMACGFGLGAVSVAIGGCIEVSPAAGDNPQWREPVNLYVAVIAEPGEGKSPMFKKMMAPIELVERELSEEHSGRFARDMADRKVKESSLARAQASLEKNTHDMSLRAEMHRLAEELTEEVKAIPQLLAADVTGEKLGGILQEQNERIGIASAEDSVWQHIGGRYNRDSPNIEIYLQAYSGDSVKVDRAARKVHLRSPSLSICVAMQPAVMLGKGTKLADDRGLMARFLFVAPARVVGTRDHSTDPPEIPAHVERGYIEKVRQIALVNLEASRTDRLLVRLDPAARLLWRKWQNDLEQRRTEDGDLYVIRGWAAKADGFALRLAGLLAVTDGVLVVSDGVLQRALVLVEYFAAHAKAAIGAALAEESVRLAVRTLAWVRRQCERAVRSDTPDGHTGTPDGFFTPRDVWKGNKSWMTSVKSKAACELLRDHGYLRQDVRGKAHGYVPNFTRVIENHLG